MTIGGASGRMDEKDDRTDGMQSLSLFVVPGVGIETATAELPGNRLGRGIFRCKGLIINLASPFDDASSSHPLR